MSWQPEAPLSPKARARELLVLALRQTAGVDIFAFQNQTGFHPEQLCGEEIRSLCEMKMLVFKNGRLKLTSNALFVSNAVFERLI